MTKLNKSELLHSLFQLSLPCVVSLSPLPPSLSPSPCLLLLDHAAASLSIFCPSDPHYVSTSRLGTSTDALVKGLLSCRPPRVSPPLPSTCTMSSFPTPMTGRGAMDAAFAHSDSNKKLVPTSANTYRGAQLCLRLHRLCCCRATQQH